MVELYNLVLSDSAGARLPLVVMSTPPIVLYNYSVSPYGQKIELVLLIKRLPYFKVKVPMTPPRPQLEMLGITYRRNPVLAIGSDVFFDSYLACLALERAFPANPIFSPHEGVQRAMSFFWTDRSISDHLPAFLEYEKMGKAFVKDREEYYGGITIDAKEEAKARPASLSALRSHLDLLEAQLDGRTSPVNYVLDTPSPTFLDISVYIFLNWLTLIPTTSSLYNGPSAKHPRSIQWTNALRSHMSSLKPLGTVIQPEHAAHLILSSTLKPTSSYVNDVYEPLLLNGDVKLGEWAELLPNDFGKVPQRGVLVAINSEMVVLEVESKESGKFIRCSAPRLAVTVKGMKSGVALPSKI